MTQYIDEANNVIFFYFSNKAVRIAIDFQSFFEEIQHRYLESEVNFLNSCLVVRIFF